MLYDNSAVIIKDYTLSDVFPESKKMVYTYDFGDNWKHDIELVQVIEEYDGELPYLLESKGQTPPEDVGGVGGFVEFRKIMLDVNDPNHEEIKVWSRYWTPELGEWKSRPDVINIPCINQVVMLRPTKSAIIFVQQLGRGLRKAYNKEFVVILDFIGNYKNNFMIPIALSDDRSFNKDNIRRFVAEGSRVIPGCTTINFDSISKKMIIWSD